MVTNVNELSVMKFSLQTRWQSPAMAVFFTMLCLSAAILGWRQYSWLAQAGESQLRAAQRDMALNVTQALDAVRQELETEVLQWLDEPGSDSLIKDYEQIAFVNGESAVETARYLDMDAFSFRSPFMRGRLMDAQDSDGSLALFIQEDILGSNRETFTIHIFILDKAEFLEQILWPAVEAKLSNYNVAFLDSDSAEFVQADAAELTLPLSEISLRPLRFTDSNYEFLSPRPRGDDAQEGEARDNITVFAQFDSILRAFQSNGLVSPEHGGLMISVSSEGGSLKSGIQTQIYLNMLFGWLVLIILVVTAMVLVATSRNLRAQQKREQEFVATISHELRTPLTVIRSAADNMKAGIVKQPEAVVRYGEEITKQSLRLDRMIESTLYYSGFRSQTTLAMQTEPAEYLSESILKPLIDVAKSKDIFVDLQSEVEFDAITTDVNGLRVILENLFMNAMIHGQALNKPSQIWVALKVTAKEIQISLADNGPGIPKDEQAKVFQAFVRGRESERQHKPGTGLGLNLVQRMVKRLGGSLKLNSPFETPLKTQQQGTQFVLSLPNHEAQKESVND